MPLQRPSTSSCCTDSTKTDLSCGQGSQLYHQLAAEASAEQGKPYPLFLGFVVAKGALEMAHECVRDGLLPLLLDLDETVVKAYPISKLTREIDCLSQKMQHQPGCALIHTPAAALQQHSLPGAA